MMREQIGVDEGYGRESYNLTNMIKSNVALQKFKK